MSTSSSDSGVEFYKHTVGEDELQSIASTFDGIFLACGPRVCDFEERFADYLDVEEVVGTSSCSMSMLLALQAFDIGPGDEVITTPMTFASTSNGVLHTGADVRFVDINPDTGMIDPSAVASAVSDQTAAIMPVHLYGQLADMKALREIADEHDLVIIEDAAHAIEAERDGIQPGALGDAATFSFYATKTMTSGDGGAIALDDPDRARRLRSLRNHGISKDAAERHEGEYEHWDMLELGYKAPMTDIDAAILLPQFDRVDDQRQRREKRVRRYRSALRGHPAIDLVNLRGCSAHHLFTIRVPEEVRDPVLAELGSRDIGCAVNYRAVHTLTYYRKELGYEPGDFPRARRFGARTISLPLWPDLPLEKVDRVVDAVDDILTRVT
jgi:dTDP-4-amino-4,6-dideoxygalactose transaminase